MQKEVLLKVDELRTEFFSSKKTSVTAVDKVSFDIYKGRSWDWWASPAAARA